MNTEKIICKIIEKTYNGCKVDKLNTNLSDDLGLDSLDKIDILTQTERMCRVRIPDVLAEEIKTAEDIVKCVNGLRAGKSINEIKHTLVPTAPKTHYAYRIDDGRIMCNLTNHPCETIKRTMTIKPQQDMCNLVGCIRYKQYQKTK